METMKGVQMVGHGDFDMLQWNESIPKPTPGKKEVLIKVLAAAVNNTDVNTRIGWYSKNNSDSDDAAWTGKAIDLPLIQGADVCGVIVEVGEGVDSSRIGERVLIEPSLWQVKGEDLTFPWYYGSECNGGFAEFTTVASQHAHAIHSDLSDVELASFPCSYSTAENLLTRSQVSSKDTVLISGASGGVGSAAIQLAKARGANVIAITSKEKAQALKEVGADVVVDRKDDLLKVLGKSSVNVVIDLVAGKMFPVFLELLMPNGRYAVSGAIGGAMVELDVRTLYLKDLKFYGCTILEREVFPNLIKLIEQGKVKPLVAHCYPLQAIKEAQQQFLQKQHIGKVVLSVAEH